jgi:hypothetical protein
MDRNPEILIRRTEKCSANLSQPEPHGIPKGHAYFVTDGSDGRWGRVLCDSGIPSYPPLHLIHKGVTI